MKSVKRTADSLTVADQKVLGRPLHGLPMPYPLHPALKRWAIFIQSASRTEVKNTFEAKLFTSQPKPNRGSESSAFTTASISYSGVRRLGAALASETKALTSQRTPQSL